MDLKLGDEVDFWREPPNRDISGWRGPATVINDTRMAEGVIGVEWQGRNLTCQLGDVRRALIMWGLFMASHFRQQYVTPREVLVRFAESLLDGHMTFACQWSTKGWTLTKACKQHPLVLPAVLHVAACELQLCGCIGGRVAHGTKTIEAVPHVDLTVLVCWKCGKFLNFFWEKRFLVL